MLDKPVRCADQRPARELAKGARREHGCERHLRGRLLLDRDAVAPLHERRQVGHDDHQPMHANLLHQDDAELPAVQRRLAGDAAGGLFYFRDVLRRLHGHHDAQLLAGRPVEHAVAALQPDCVPFDPGRRRARFMVVDGGREYCIGHVP